MNTTSKNIYFIVQKKMSWIRSVGGAAAETTLAVKKPELAYKFEMAKIIVGGVVAIGLISIFAVALWKSEPIQRSAPVKALKARFAKPKPEDKHTCCD